MTELRSDSAHAGVRRVVANNIRGQSTGLAAYARALSRATLMVLSAGCAGAHVSNAPSTSTQVSTQGAATSGTQVGGTLGGVGGGTQMSSSLPGCPGGNGIRISATSGTGTDSSSVLNTVVNERQSIDTTMVFDVALKSWTRTNLAAQITVGLADQARGGYAICAGVSALIPSATLTIKGARGQVHFAATLQDLLNSIRSGPGGTSPQLRRM
jgi:hypothetical protein